MSEDLCPGCRVQQQEVGAFADAMRGLVGALGLETHPDPAVRSAAHAVAQTGARLSLRALDARLPRHLLAHDAHTVSAETEATTRP